MNKENTNQSTNEESDYVFALYSYYNYRKEHFCELYGIYTDQSIASSKMKEHISTDLKEKYSWNSDINIVEKGDLIGIELGDKDEEEWAIFRTEKINAKGINIKSPVYLNIQYNCVVWGSFKSEPIAKVVGLYNDISKCLVKPIQETFYCPCILKDAKDRNVLIAFETMINK